MEIKKHLESDNHEFFDGAIVVYEYNFQDTTLNDAEIQITGRYPLQGYAVNDVSVALVSVESGIGTIARPGSESQSLEVGDRLVIQSGEPYAFEALGKLAIRYVATPAWNASQARIVEG